MQDRFETFTTLVSKINRNLKRIKAEEMKAFNLKSTHLNCIYYLFKSKSLTSKELCELCDEDKASLSRSLDFLENNGYVVCKDDSKKRYNSQLMLTEKGEEIGFRLDQTIKNVFKQANDWTSEEDRKIM